MSTQTIQNILLCEIDDTATDLQIRCENDPDQIDNLKEAIESGKTLPPIVVFLENHDPNYKTASDRFHIADGWHRYYAHKEAKFSTILADIRTGTREDALKYALGANADHGLRRTNRDKRNAVLVALKSHNAIFGTNKIKNVDIAELCRVAESFVRKIRKEEDEKTAIPASKLAQCDFFAELDVTCKQFSETFKKALNHTYFLSVDISNDEKIKTIDAMERDLKKHHQALRDLKAKLQNQDPDVLNELVDTAETLLF